MDMVLIKENDDNISYTSDDKEIIPKDYLKFDFDEDHQVDLNNINSSNKFYRAQLQYDCKSENSNYATHQSLNVRFKDRKDELLLIRARKESKLDSIVKTSLQPDVRKRRSCANTLKLFGMILDN